MKLFMLFAKHGTASPGLMMGVTLSDSDVDTFALLNEAITREIDMPLVTKWMVLGELVDEDGDRRLFHITSEHCLMADQLGLMAAHGQYTQARRTAEVIAGDE